MRKPGPVPTLKGEVGSCLGVPSALSHTGLSRRGLRGTRTKDRDDRRPLLYGLRRTVVEFTNGSEVNQ